MPEDEFLGTAVGKVVHYFNRIGVSIVELDRPLYVGDTIRVAGKRTDFTQAIESMQIQHTQITEASAGQSVGLKVEGEPRINDTVYKL